jgi:uncharacterized protein (DUF1778 family)
MGGRTSAASKNKWNEKAYDRINFVVPKGQKDIIKQAAEKVGKSVNAYIWEAVQNRMEQEQAEQ